MPNVLLQCSIWLKFRLELKSTLLLYRDSMCILWVTLYWLMLQCSIVLTVNRVLHPLVAMHSRYHYEVFACEHMLVIYMFTVFILNDPFTTRLNKWVMSDLTGSLMFACILFEKICSNDVSFEWYKLYMCIINLILSSFLVRF